MKALFRPFVLHAAYTPIETIVFFCIIGTLAYFHVLSAIRHSAFLDPAQAIYAQPTLKAAYALYQSGEWVTVRDKTFLGAVKAKTDTTLEVQQVVYTLDLPRHNKDNLNEYSTLSLSQRPMLASTLNLTKFISTSFTSGSGRAYTTSCHRPSVPTLNSAQPHSDATSSSAEAGESSQSQYEPCFAVQQGGQHKHLQTLTFKPGMRDDFVSELTGESLILAHTHYHHGIGHHAVAPIPKAKTFIDESGVKFEVNSGKNADALPLGQMRNGKWVAYAARALVIRFWDLAKKADSLDILLILAGYILMHTTFYLLLTRSRKLGSSFWLPLAIMSSAILALLISLPIAMALKIPIDPVALTEALPFLVCTVGFDKPLRLARAVFLHPHLTVPPPPGSSAISGYPTTQPTSQTLLSPLPLSQSQAQQLKPAPRIITESLSLVYAPIIRDYILEIAVLTVGAYSKVGGLREVCALAALILGVDCLLLTTYLAAILGVMVEVRRIKTVRAMTRSRSNSFSSVSTSSSIATPRQRQSAMVKPSVTPAHKTLKQRVMTVLLGGEKGCSLPGYEGGVISRKSIRKARQEKEKPENPVARLKLLLIASFLILHILNLITPLTPSRQASSASSGQLSVRKVDITSPPLRSVLQALVEASRHDLGMTFDDEDGEPTTERNMVVKVHPPVHIKVVPPPSLLAAHRSRVPPSAQGPSSSLSAPSFLPHTFNALTSTPKATSDMIEAFMSSWTRLVGDPILSKWIVVMLAISFALNGYLLKGIAAGVVGARVRVGLGGVRFEQGVDREEVEEVEVAEKVQRVQVRHVEVQHVEVPQQQVVLPVEEKKRPKPPSPLSSVTNVTTFTLEDVDRKLKASKAAKAARRKTITSSSATPKPHGTSHPTPPESASESSASSSETSHDADTEESDSTDVDLDVDLHVRTLEECIDIFENGPRPLSASLALLNDEEVILLAQNGKVAAYALEKVLGMDQLERAVRIRRALISRASSTQTLEFSDVPLSHYDYSRVLGACCENVVGYIPIPLGIAGPLNIDGSLYPIPMATAEGTLVASTSRGCKALNAGGGVTTVLTKDGMTRGPAIDFPTVTMAAEAKCWIDSEDGYATIKEAFESTSRFAKLKSLKTAMAGRTLFVRFATGTGDAMGMNMISKGTEKALEVMQKHYPEMVTLALSGNYCTDKKPAAINWIDGRGKSVVAEAIIPGSVVKTVLKTTVDALCNLNLKKNLVGSAMAGSIGGFNAHAANILTAIFLATGQDPAQNVESSMCMTLMEPINNDQDLLMTITMPCIEVGTVGGGTVLGPQQGVLEMLGIKGAHPTHPGHNAQALARLIAASVMAGELSLLSALAAGHLIRAHMAHNRSQANTPAVSVPATPGPTMGPVVKGFLTNGEKEDEKDKLDKSRPLSIPLTPSSSTSSLPPYSQ